ncbi:hypothetical protein C8R44DRAFT_992479 [Mycena epipterygia]|nr:hypothetical protein C8R44DRAFT_992479 [Mycena epipterygia]
MSSRPRRSGSGARPGDIIKASTQQRRSRHEIDADDLAAAKAQAEQEQKIQRKHRTGVSRVAAKEDALREEDEQAQIDAARPDLVTEKAVEREQEADEWEKVGVGVGDEQDVSMLSVDDGERDLDPAHDSGSSADDGDGEYKPASDGKEVSVDESEFPAGADDDGHDADTSDTSDSDAERDRASALAQFLAQYEKKKGKAKTPSKPKKSKPKRGELRAEIMGSRKVDAAAPPSTSVKRKSANQGAETQPSAKKPKAMVGGLKKDWKQEFASKSTPSRRSRPSTSSVTGGVPSSRASSTSARRSGASSEVPAGEFDDDEQPEVVRAARDAKTSTPATAKMGISFTNKDVKLRVDGKQQRETKRKYVNADLPFTLDGFAADLKVWQSSAIPIIIDWAGSLDAPFTAAAHPDFRSVVEEAWSDNFPAYEITDAVYSLASAAISNWRSDIRKRGLAVVTRILNGKKFSTIDERRAHAEAQLVDFPFIYGDPVTKAGAYRTDPIYHVMEAHFRITDKTVVTYGAPVGALSAVASSLERGYSIWRTGKPATEGLERRGKRTAHSFVAAPWAVNAAAYLPQIKKLKNKHWGEIWTNSTATFAGDSALLGDGGADTSSEGYVDKRSLIVISDDEDED